MEDARTVRETARIVIRNEKPLPAMTLLIFHLRIINETAETSKGRQAGENLRRIDNQNQNPDFTTL